VLVCELMPCHHDIEIAVAVDKEVIREPLYINNATYIDIVAATSAQTRPMIMKITAGESGDECRATTHSEKKRQMREGVN